MGLAESQATMRLSVPTRLFFFNDTATTEIYTLSLHDALPLSNGRNGHRHGMVHTPRTLPPSPQLVKRGKQWTARFQAIASGSAKGDWATRSAKKVLCAALRGLAYGKCVYCEGALEPQGYVEVDHYVAKTVDRKLVFEWPNLLPACRRCNNPKRAQDHKGALLKPDDEDPEPYFWIHPDTGRLEAHPNLNADQTQRANETIRLD